MPPIVRRLGFLFGVLLFRCARFAFDEPISIRLGWISFGVAHLNQRARKRVLFQRCIGEAAFFFFFFFPLSASTPCPPPRHISSLFVTTQRKDANGCDSRGEGGSRFWLAAGTGDWPMARGENRRGAGGGSRFWRRALTLSAGGSLSTQRRWCRLSLSETPAGQWGRGNGRPIRCLPPPFLSRPPPPTRFIYSSFSFTSSSAPPRPARSAAGVERGREKWNGEGSGMDEKKVDWLVSLYVIKSYWARLHLLSLEYAARSVLLIDLELVSRKNGLGVFS